MALSEKAPGTRYTIKIKLKLRLNEFWKRKVFSCLLKDGSELAEVTTGDRLFHVSLLIIHLTWGRPNREGVGALEANAYPISVRLRGGWNICVQRGMHGLNLVDVVIVCPAFTVSNSLPGT